MHKISTQVDCVNSKCPPVSFWIQQNIPATFLLMRYVYPSSDLFPCRRCLSLCRPNVRKGLRKINKISNLTTVRDYFRVLPTLILIYCWWDKQVLHAVTKQYFWVVFYRANKTKRSSATIQVTRYTRWNQPLWAFKWQLVAGTKGTLIWLTFYCRQTSLIQTLRGIESLRINRVSVLRGVD